MALVFTVCVIGGMWWAIAEALVFCLQCVWSAYMAAVHHARATRVFVNCDDFYGDAHSTAYGLMGTDGERGITYVVGRPSSVRTLHTPHSSVIAFNVYRDSRDVFHGRASATGRRTEIGTFRRNDIDPLSVGPASEWRGATPCRLAASHWWSRAAMRVPRSSDVVRLQWYIMYCTYR